MKKALLSLSLIFLANNVVFTQSCEPYSVPLTENFQTAVFPDLPECWSRVIDGWGEVKTGYPFGNPEEPLYCFLHAYDGSAYLISPELNHPLDDLRLIFTSSYEGISAVILEIGSMSDPTDKSTYNTLVQLSGSSEPEIKMIYFNEYSGNDRHIVFRLKSDAYNDWGDWYIYDILIEPNPDCPAPSGFFADEITSTSARVGWIQPGDIHKWDLVFGEPGFDPGSEGILIEDLVESSYKITGLASNSVYHTRVRAKCDGETGQWSPYYAFKTGCGAYEIPFSENFESDIWPPQMPDCWRKLEYGNSTISIHNDFVGISPGTGQGSAFLITPELTFSPGGFRLEFKAENDNMENNLLLKIGSMSEPNDTSTYKQITEVLLTSGYETYTIYFDEDQYPYIVLKMDFTGTESWDYIRIGKITIDNIPECTTPWNLTAGEITTTSARLGWTQPGNVNGWDVIYGAYGFNPEYDNGIIIENLQDTSFIIDNLSYGTKYDFRVRAVCNGEKNRWSAAASFTTDCGLTSIPLYEDFVAAHYTHWPACWNKIQDGKATVKTSWGRIDIFVEQGSGFLITPELDQPLQGLRLKVGLYVSTNNGGMLEIGSMTDPADLTTFNALTQIALPLTHEEEDLTVYFSEYSGSDRHIAIVLRKDNLSWASRLHISEVLIEEIPECHEPFEFTAGEITDTSAALSWVHPKDIGNWEVVYGDPGTFDEPGFDPDKEGTIIGDITEKSFVVTGLEPARNYQFYVRGICNGEPGEWSRPVTLLTECGPFNIPVFEDFYTHYFLPHCWHKIEEGFTEVFSDQDGAVMTSYGGSGYLVTPELSSPLSGLRLVFWAKKENFLALQIGSMSDPEDKTTFNLLTQIDLSSEFDLYYFTFDQHPYDDRHIAFRIEKIDQSPGTIVIADVEIRDVSDCMKPWGLSSSNLSYSSTRLSWNHFPEIDQWDVTYGSSWFDPHSQGTIIEGIEENTYVIEDLDPYTNYQFFVRGKCNGTVGEWSGPHIFLTRCSPADLPLIEGFDRSYSMPSCWTAVSAIVNWHNYKHGSDLSVHLYQEPDKSAFLISPQISTDLKDVRVSFTALRPDKMTGGGNSELILGTMSNPDDATTFTAFTSFFVMDEKESGFQEFVVWLDTYEGNDQFIAFKLGDETDPYWYSAQMLIDDIIIDVIPECPEPWNISAAGITKTSAVISWSQVGDAESWDVAYGHTGFNPGAAGSLIEDISEKSFEINSLDPGTSYQVYVRAHCNDKTSNWSIPYTYSTECIAFDVPFSESFDNPTFPLCWSHTPSKEMDFVRWEVVSAGSGNSYEILGSFSNGEGVSRLITPPIDLSPALSVNLQFDHFYVSYLEGVVILKIQTSQDKENWVNEDFRLEAGNNRIGPATVEVPIINISENTYIAWAIVQPGNSGNWWLDSVKVTYEPATPIVEWPAASPVIYGDKLSDSALEGGRAWHSEYDVAGRFVFDDQNMILPAGENHQVALTFLPDKGFNTVKGFVSITVYKADPAVTWPETSTLIEGEPLSESNLTGGSASHKGVSVPGEFSFLNPETLPPAGEYQADIIFRPNDQDNFNDVAGTVMVTVTDVTQAIMVPGRSLSGIQVYPNPFTSGITLLNAENVLRVMMTDVIGRIVVDVKLNGSETENLNTASLHPGVYLMTIYSEKEEVMIRMIKTR